MAVWCFFEKMPIVLERVDEGDIWGKYLNKKRVCRPFLKELQPIPLTEKILLDSGFEAYQAIFSVNHYKITFGDFTFYVSMSSNEPIYAISQSGSPSKVIPCHNTEFVHDLQNAYRLATGENLNIIIK